MDDFREMVRDEARDGTADAPSIALKILIQTARKVHYLKERAVEFSTTQIGLWAREGIRQAVAEALKHGAMRQKTVSQLPLFAEGAYVPERGGYVSKGLLTLEEWRSAKAYKQLKGQQVLAEAERMDDFEREHLELWELHPDWTAEEVEREMRRRGEPEAA